jgi:Cys-tRNA(Pro)/Cys-tRNA(Cys) deacylase
MIDGDSESTPVTVALQNKGISYKFFRHPGQLHSLEQAAQERGQVPNQVVRSILFRISEDDFVMVLVAGPGQLSWGKLRKFLNQSRMSMASEEEVMRVTGFPRGAVSPFGLPTPIRIIVDESVMLQEEISIGSGVRNTTIIMQRVDLLRALGEVEVGDFTVGDEA